MAQRALRIFENFDDAVGGICDFRRTGAIITARAEDVGTITANVALQRSVGIVTRMVSPEDLRELEPHANLAGIAAAAYEPESGYADPHATATSYANRATELGAEILAGTEVRSIVVENGRTTGVVTEQGRIDAGAVIVAAGPWSRSLMRQCDIDLPTTAVRAQIGLFNRVPEIERHCTVLDATLGIYSRPEGSDLMLVGSLETSETKDKVDDPDAYPETADFERITHYSERLTRRYPAMSGGSFLNGYASLYDVTPDWQPILDALPGVDNLYCATGSSGHGFKLAPVVGEMMADLVLDGKRPEDDINMFAFERFATGELVGGKYAQKILA